MNIKEVGDQKLAMITEKLNGLEGMPAALAVAKQLGCVREKSA
jgi:hypothetical protein